MVFAITLKKPICIESKVVDKIDRVYSQGQEAVYRCPQKPTQSYSRFFDEHLNQIESRIDSVSQFLNSLGGLKAGLKIRLDENQPMLFKISNHEIQIGWKLAQAEGHLERAVIKIWINENTMRVSEQTDLFNEVVADFLIFTFSGQLNLVDPITQMKVNLGQAKWPQILKSVESYCDSSWKASEHYLECHRFHKSSQLNQEEILNLSLRPLLTQAWIKAYKELSLKERLSFFRLFPRFLQTQSLSSEKVAQQLSSETHPLKFGIKGLKRITDLMNSSSLVQNEMTYREFYSQVTHGLQQSGVSDSFAEAYFDYLIEIPQDLTIQTKVFKNIFAMAQKNPQFQIAIKDKQQIWILPNKDSLPLATFDKIKAQQIVYMACLGLKEIDIKSFVDQAEKLLLIKGCDPDKIVKLDSLFKKGISGFSRDNKALAFIQFHLPSFELKARELSHIRNFFELVSSRDMNKPEFQSLGWRQVQWFEESQAYRPHATVDAIELFRAESLEKKLEKSTVQ